MFCNNSAYLKAIEIIVCSEFLKICYYIRGLLISLYYSVMLMVVKYQSQ